jgi:diguanylate cyclase (GGDEF)-like protein/PAS domain S-box-containing protein
MVAQHRTPEDESAQCASLWPFLEGAAFGLAFRPTILARRMPVMKHSELPNWPPGGGAMGGLIRDFDWSSTRLGPLLAWPNSLKTAVDILLRLPTPAVLLWGADGIMIYNDGYAAMSGGRHPKLLGASVFEGWPAPAHVAFNANVLKVCLAGGALAYRDERFTVERDGRQEQIWLNLDYAPVLDEVGKPAGVFCFVVDTSTKVQAEEALRESEQRYRMLAELSPDGILINVGGQIAYANRSALQLLGASNAAQIVGRSPFDLMLPEHGERTRDHFRKIMGGSSRHPLDLGLRRLDDAEIYVEAVAGRVVWNGKPAVELLLRDITRRKRADEALRAAEAGLTIELEAMNLLYDLSTRLLASPDLTTALEEVLDAAIEMLGAVMGYVHLCDPHTHKFDIVAHRGFQPEFLAYFRAVDIDDSLACARAMKSGMRVIIPDVQTDPAYARHRKIASTLSYRAVQSTPMIGRDGRLLGVLSTLFRQPRSPSARDLRMLDLYAHQAIGLIERIHAEEALRESENRFRRALQIDTVGVVFFDHDGRITEANDAFLRMSGFTREDAATGRLRCDQLTPPEWMPESLHAIEELKAKGRTTPYEKECFRKDGSRWWALFAAQQLSEKEAVEYVLDLSERKRMEQALRESEERFRALAEASPALIWQIDPAGAVVYLNPQFAVLTGKNEADLMGAGWRSLFHPDDVIRYCEAIAKSQRERARLRQRVRVICKDGGWCWLETHALPWFNTRGEYAGHVGISIDITEAMKSELMQITYRMATEGGNEGFYIFRPVCGGDGNLFDFEIIDSNQRGAELLGRRREDLIGKNISGLYSQRADFERAMEILQHAAEKRFFEDDVEVPRGSPLKVHWVHCKIVRSHDDLAVTLRDISDAKAHVDELERRGNEDVLTGLPNRYWVQSYLPKAIEHAVATHEKLAVLFMDLDGFKAVNDALGHPAGDELLRNAARRLKLAVRPQDKVVRFGGDEFVFILENITGKRDAQHVAERVLNAFRKRFTLSRGVQSVGTSIGISLFPSDGRDADTLLQNADIAMYSVKTSGKQNYRFFDPEFYGALRARLERESELRHAVEQDQFIVYYQPRVDISNGVTCSMEALVRWLHPTKGLVEPLEFIPLAEDTGLIFRLGELVIDKVCAQLTYWARNGKELLPVSINVSPRQFNEANIAGTLAASVARHHVDPRLIEIELTESSMMGSSASVSSALSAIRGMGIKLLVDDFGTGYSSLSQLQRLDFDVLKVDRAFTMETDRTERGRVFFRAIITMAHALGMRVVAEGVENEKQIKILKSLCCDEIQGFYISRPLPPSQLQAVLPNCYLPSAS